MTTRLVEIPQLSDRELAQLRQHDLFRSYCEWFQPLDWGHICTLTYRHAPSSLVMMKSHFRSLRRRIVSRGKMGRDGLRWVAVFEKLPQFHVHALLAPISSQAQAVLHSFWTKKNGDVDVQPYDGNRGWIEYLCSKHVKYNDEAHLPVTGGSKELWTAAA